MLDNERLIKEAINDDKILIENENNIDMATLFSLAFFIHRFVYILD